MRNARCCFVGGVVFKLSDGSIRVHSRSWRSLNDSLEDKIRAVATKIYGAADIKLSPEAREQLDWIAQHKLDKVPICSCVWVVPYMFFVTESRLCVL